MAVACAVPARAVRLRLQQATAEPSWAVYLPTAAWRSRLTLWADEPFEQGHCFDGAGAAPAGPGPGRGTGRAGPGEARAPCAAAAAPAPAAAAAPARCAPAPQGAPRPPWETVGRAAPPQDAPERSGDVGGCVWALSRTPQGCRRVQQALDDARGPEACGRLAAELRGHVWDALRCPHANFVLQKCITTASPDACQFIVDELLQRGHGALAQAARHRYGCRIVERLLERCRPEQVEQIVDCILDDAVTLCMHPYGNYVAQHLLEHAAPERRDRLAKVLVAHVGTLGTDCYALAVLGRALSGGPRAAELARAVLAEEGLLASMARTRQGQLASKLAVQAIEDPGQRGAARRRLAAEAAQLRAPTGQRAALGGAAAGGGPGGAPAPPPCDLGARPPPAPPARPAG